MEVNELRITERFRTAEALSGSYGSASVTLLDVSATGAQIEHSQPLRIGTRARLWFKRGDVSLNLQAVTIWSHLSKTPNVQGKYLYHSGLRIEADTREFNYALQALLDHGVLSPDRESLERKRKRALERVAEKNNRSTVKFPIQNFHGGTSHVICTFHDHGVDAAGPDRRHQVLIEAD